MNLKNIIKLSIIFLPFFFLSCQKIDSYKKIDNKIIAEIKDEIEDIESIDNTYRNNNKSYFDYYSKSINFLWHNDKVLKKEITIKNSPTKYLDSPSLTINIINDKIYSLNKFSDLKTYNFNDKNNKKYQLFNNSNNEFSYPTSIAMLDNFLFAGYSNGTLIKFDLIGNIIWQLELNDILKTPIKIHNKNIIVILSNKIISINTSDANIEWEFIYDNDNSLNIIGGKIASKNHLLFFSLPNGRLGAIDTILSTKVDTLFSKINQDYSLSDTNITIHSFQNFLSIYSNDKYLYSIDIQKNIFLLEKNKVDNVKSYNFINNSLIIINNQNKLKAYNIKNKKIFWITDLSEYLNRDEKIVEIINNKKRIIIFFNNGLILEVDIITGKVLFSQKIKLDKIKSVSFINNYVLFNQINGRTTLFKQ